MLAAAPGSMALGLASAGDCTRKGLGGGCFSWPGPAIAAGFESLNAEGRISELQPLADQSARNFRRSPN